MTIKKYLLAALFTLSATFASAQDKTIRIGVTSGPDLQIWEFLEGKAKDKGLKLELVEFSDYITPNEATNAGDIDANAFQHLPYLESQVKSRGYKLVSIGYTFNSPMGFFSKKYKNWKDLPKGAKIAIPNDPSNGGRALLILEKNGDIKLDKNVGLTPTPLDIIENPKDFEFITMDAASTPRSLDDLDAAAVNNNFAIVAGLDLVNGTILLESADSPYANIIVVHEKNKDAPWAKALVELYQTPETARFIKDTYKGASIPAWTNE